MIGDHVIQDQEFEHVKRLNASKMTYRLIFVKNEEFLISSSFAPAAKNFLKNWKIGFEVLEERNLETSFFFDVCATCYGKV